MAKILQNIKRFISRKVKGIKENLAKRRDARRVNQMVEHIYKATGIYLDAWQREFVFRRGEYMSEAKAGRHNGKTTANIFRMLMMGMTTFLVDMRSFVIIVGSHWGFDTMHYMKEDANILTRRAYFISKLRMYYDILSKDKWFKGKICNLEFGQFIIQKVNDLDEYKDEE